MPTAPGDRAEISELIDLDEAYDADPSGEPPLLVARYRAALRAALATRPAEPGLLLPTWTDREQEAYLAGGQATLQAAVGAMAAALAGGRTERQRTASPHPPAAPLQACPNPSPGFVSSPAAGRERPVD